MLRNGRKVHAHAKGVSSEYNDGTQPSGKRIVDVNCYICKCMSIKLRSTSIGENEDNGDVVMSTTANK